MAEALGISATTLRRMAEGVIPKAKRVFYARGKDARVYTAKHPEAISMATEQWRMRHPGRCS